MTHVDSSKEHFSFVKELLLQPALQVSLFGVWNMLLELNETFCQTRMLTQRINNQNELVIRNVVCMSTPLLTICCY